MKRDAQRKKPGINTLVLIGNGFDRWQGLNTSYSDFQKYYLAHRDEILKKLHINEYYGAAGSSAIIRFCAILFVKIIV